MSTTEWSDSLIRRGINPVAEFDFGQIREDNSHGGILLHLSKIFEKFLIFISSFVVSSNCLLKFVLN